MRPQEEASPQTPTIMGIPKKEDFPWSEIYPFFEQRHVTRLWRTMGPNEIHLVSPAAQQVKGVLFRTHFACSKLLLQRHHLSRSIIRSSANRLPYGEIPSPLGWENENEVVAMVTDFPKRRTRQQKSMPNLPSPVSYAVSNRRIGT